MHIHLLDSQNSVREKLARPKCGGGWDAGLRSVVNKKPGAPGLALFETWDLANSASITQDIGHATSSAKNPSDACTSSLFFPPSSRSVRISASLETPGRPACRPSSFSHPLGWHEPT